MAVVVTLVIIIIIIEIWFESSIVWDSINGNNNNSDNSNDDKKHTWQENSISTRAKRFAVAIPCAAWFSVLDKACGVNPKKH